MLEPLLRGGGGGAITPRAEGIEVDEERDEAESAADGRRALGTSNVVDSGDGNGSYSDNGDAGDTDGGAGGVDVEAYPCGWDCDCCVAGVFATERRVGGGGGARVCDAPVVVGVMLGETCDVKGVVWYS